MRLWQVGAVLIGAALSSCSNACPEGTRASVWGCREEGQTFYLSWSVPTVVTPEIHYPRHLKIGPPP